LTRCLDRPAATACGAAGIDPAAIEDLLGAYAVSMVWGAAFEDLLATDLPNGRKFADDCLRRRGWTKAAATRKQSAELRHAAISHYEVSRAMERSGFCGLRQWD
jgi:hypothetical protein